MANDMQLNTLGRGIRIWNGWRSENPSYRIDLSSANLVRVNLQDADLHGADLRRADLRGANLNGADLSRANLIEAKLSGAYIDAANLQGSDLSLAYLDKAELCGSNLCNADIRHANLQHANLDGANLQMADLRGADLRRALLYGADLRGTKLCGADLTAADLSGANFSGVNLEGIDLTNARLVETNFERANLTNCNIYGISAWALNLKGTIQNDLIITPYGEPIITVDDLEVAQFIYLLLNNEKIRRVINTITSKVVLILGRFTPERKEILNAIREELRKYDYLPVLFDFDKPSTRNTLETVRLLASLARFIIADITDPRSIPQELGSVVPSFPSVPVKPILQAGHEPWGMYDSIQCFSSVLELYKYQNLEDLLSSIKEAVIAPAEAKAYELQK
jgi:uncharacterized protein YjbI with pentapeptide repeats